jgi:hypothetical protein
LQRRNGDIDNGIAKKLALGFERHNGCFDLRSLVAHHHTVFDHYSRCSVL